MNWFNEYTTYQNLWRKNAWVATKTVPINVYLYMHVLEKKRGWKLSKQSPQILIKKKQQKKLKNKSQNIKHKYTVKGIKFFRKTKGIGHPEWAWSEGKEEGGRGGGATLWGMGMGELLQSSQALQTFRRSPGRVAPVHRGG